MTNPLEWMAVWFAEAILDKLREPINTMNERLDRLERLHEQDQAALECDLSVMDDRICSLIGICRRRGYTTADERRRVTRMHDAYRARGGNHGEEHEYAVFLTLPTQEAYEMKKGKKDEEGRLQGCCGSGD